ncbi:hypothetical protein M422DRAFT_23152 [Sphaerobolus stellatus SS14]|nr:hypothetical protein M422DRAFT_23152 [Sphaerobolus stellatus SS14]
MFHKPVKKEIADALNKPKPRPRVRVPIPKPKAEPEAEEEWKPSGQYQEFRILSTGQSAWKYDIMKFDVRGKDIDPTKWNQPVKLNRKAVRPQENDDAEPIPIELKPMLGPDGKPVVGPDGKMVMVGPDGKVPPAGGATVKTNGKDPSKGKGKGKIPFKKKTKQVYLVPEADRKLRYEERYPWVMEEAGANGQTWVGQLDVDRSETHGLLVPTGTDFMFIPAHRWYKFHKKPSYRILALEEAEAEYAKAQKNKDPERWLMRKKAGGGAGPSEATLATLKREKSNKIKFEEDDGMTLTTVDKGEDDLFGDDDDDDGGRSNKKNSQKYDMEGDADEVEYEDSASDDEEKEEMDGDDEETRELEERIKKEYRQANKFHDGHIDADNEEDDLDSLTGAGKDLKKLVKRTEKNEAYDSDDDEKNPYVSDEEEPEETPQPVIDGPAVMNQNQTPTPSQPPSGTATPVNRGQTPRPTKPSSGSKPLQHPLPTTGASRATSPGLGNAVVAKRATSPKAPKPKAMPGSGSRPGSPLASRASSPAPPSTSVAPTPTPQNLKRKATDDAPTSSGTSTAGADSKPKKKAKRPLEESMVIEWLKQNTEVTTRECIQKFQPYLKNEEAKQAFTAMVRKIAVVKNNQMKLRPEYL